jgi:hypothetical protein
VQFCRSTRLVAEFDIGILIRRERSCHGCKRRSDTDDVVLAREYGLLRTALSCVAMTSPNSRVTPLIIMFSAGTRAPSKIGEPIAQAKSRSLYSRAQSMMGGTSQIQRNLVPTRVLGLPS